MEAKHYHVFVEPSADRRLASHIEFLARVSEIAAVKLYEAYRDALTFLEDSPKSCPLYESQTKIDAELRYKLFYERYRIVFEIVDNSVYAYDIQDCRQDMAKNLI
ncbi:MAG: type II toxin-antitoxin system RelE/ParE family toxin [Peptococcaceae bacterium]|nr:type II toxin-antitoxin system RelE/ParE family toxin [Peptococcaceae bacterium]